MYFFREKKLLVGSEDYGKDLTGVQNLRKKHKRLDAELASHEPAIQVSRDSENIDSNNELKLLKMRLEWQV